MFYIKFTPHNNKIVRGLKTFLQLIDSIKMLWPNIFQSIFLERNLILIEAP